MRKEYNKLVRVSEAALKELRIPEIIRQDNRECEVATMTQEEYRQALREKLIEEAREAAEADTQKLVTELADLYEVMDAIMAIYGIERESVLAEQERRRTERGGFHKRIRLLWTQVD